MSQILKQILFFPVVFPDLGTVWDMNIEAVVFGADLLKKIITTDCCTRSIKHVFSSKGAESATFICVIRDLETALRKPEGSFKPGGTQEAFGSQVQQLSGASKKEADRGQTTMYAIHGTF